MSLPPPNLLPNRLFAVNQILAEKSLYEFLKQAWPVFDPSRFSGNWHIGALAEHLQAVNDGQIKRLLANVPPRSGKTALVAIAWPLWTWIQKPDPDYPLKGPGVRFLCAAYGANKAQADGVTSRRLIDSQWFQQRWGRQVIIDKTRDNQEQFDNTAGGYRISTGIPESLGKGGAIRIVDDPHKVDEVESKLVIASQIRAYNEVWRTRSNDPKYGAEVIIMQRLGEDDLSGHLLSREEDIVHICLPMRFEEGRRCVTVLGFEDPRQEDDELLWPDRFDDDWCQQQQTAIGAYTWAGQFQQRPEPRGGGLIKRHWWKIYGPDDPTAVGARFPPFSFVLGALDTAYTEKKENDPSAMVLLGVWQHPETGYQNVMIVYAWEAHLEVPDLVRRVKYTGDKYKIDRLLIENTAAGQPVEQELSRMLSRENWGIEFSSPNRSRTGGKVDKWARLHAVSHLFEEGMVHRPNTQWAVAVEDEVCIFPRAARDDYVDCVSMGLKWLRDSGLLHNRAEQKVIESELEQYRGGRSVSKPLYAA